MDGHARTTAERLRDWLDARPEVSQSALAARCHVGRQRISDAVKGGAVSLHLRKALERETGIEADAWDADTAPASAPAVPPRPLGSTRDELADTVSQIDAALRLGGLTPAQKGQLLGKRATVLTAISRLEQGAAIHEHPDADGFLEDVVQAVYDTLGSDAPEGLGSQIAERFLELQTRRAEAPRKAAA